MSDVPIPNCYWVTDGLLLAGGYPGAGWRTRASTQLERFLDAGIRCFLDLMEEGELRAYDSLLTRLAEARGIEVQHCRFPVRDMDVPDEARMEEVLALIKRHVEAGTPVYVHCWGGIGRTGTVMACWLVQEHNLSADEALARLTELREAVPYAGPSPETEEQRRFVRNWEKRVSCRKAEGSHKV